MKKLMVLACAVVLAMGLAACSGGSGASPAASGVASTGGGEAASAAANDNLQDYGFVAFEMPDGWADDPESDSYATISEQANDDHQMKISVRTLMSSYPTAADLAAYDIAKGSNSFTDAGKKTIGDYEWSLAGFEHDGNQSFKAYADAADGKAFEVTIYEMDIDDPAVQTVLSTIVIGEE